MSQKTSATALSNFAPIFPTQSETPNYTCKQCGRGFKYKPNLAIHERTHDGVYPYYCPYCGKGASATANLRAHMKRFHTGVEEFKCIHCQRVDFKHVRELKQHLDGGCGGEGNGGS